MRDFDKAFYINLKRRPDRDAEFNSQPVVEEMKLRWKLERFEGVDEEPPREFTLKRGVWGCYQSHLRILERIARNPQWSKVIIFEDDATFNDNFFNRFDCLTEPCDNLEPNGWAMLYLGGQPLVECKSRYDTAQFLRCNNINRTHAYAVNRVYLNYILAGLYKKENLFSNHVDTIYGKLHPYLPTFIVKTRLVGQREGLSDVNGLMQTRRNWTNQTIKP